MEVWREFVLPEDTPLEGEVKEMIAEKLRDAVDRFAAICGDRDGNQG